MYPHRIRLRGPWECEPPGQPRRRVTLPGRWADLGLKDCAGRVLFRRRFGCPTNVDADERVWLTCGGVADRAAATLNGVPLGDNLGPEPFEIEVTTVLRPRNELVMIVEGGTDGGLWGEVAMEVRRTAFLRGVTARFVPRPDGDADLTVTGTAVGTAPRALELYVVAGRSTVAYAGVTPTAEGAAFRLAGTAAADAAVQVDLVGGAEVWYTWRSEGSAEAPADG